MHKLFSVFSRRLRPGRAENAPADSTAQELAELRTRYADLLVAAKVAGLDLTNLLEAPEDAEFSYSEWFGKATTERIIALTAYAFLGALTREEGNGNAFLETVIKIPDQRRLVLVAMFDNGHSPYELYRRALHRVAELEAELAALREGRELGEPAESA